MKLPRPRGDCRNLADAVVVGTCLALRYAVHEQDPREPPPCVECLPGDITVTAVPNGFLIGRVLPQSGFGPWWEYIKIAATHESALHDALALASAADARAWFHREDATYEEILPIQK